MTRRWQHHVVSWLNLAQIWHDLCLLRGDETGLDGSDSAKRRAGEDDIPGRIPAGVVQLCICGILVSAILAMAAVGAAPDELEALPRPPYRNKHSWASLVDCQ